MHPVSYPTWDPPIHVGWGDGKKRGEKREIGSSLLPLTFPQEKKEDGKREESIAAILPTR